MRVSGVVYVWKRGAAEVAASPRRRLARGDKERGFLSALFLFQALGRRGLRGAAEVRPAFSYCM